MSEYEIDARLGTDPDPARIDPDGIDEYMKRGEWFVWDTSGAKRPLDPEEPGDLSVSFNDLGRARSFETALEVAERDGYGLTYPLKNRDPDNPAEPTAIVAIDVDIRDEQGDKGGGEWVTNLDRLGGASGEYSPSGNVRLYLRDVEIPEWWDDLSTGEPDRPELGLYDTEKHVTVTGDVIEGLEPPIGTCNQPAFEQWCKEQWYNFHEQVLEADVTVGEDEPWVDDEDDENAGGRSFDDDFDMDDIKVTDLSFVSADAGERVAHPVHGSSNGNNFVIDADETTWRCWRAGHECTGNALQLLGVDAGIIDCGEWTGGGLDSETWSEIFDEARDRGFDIPEPKSQAATADGGATATGSATGSVTGENERAWYERFSAWLSRERRGRTDDDDGREPGRREKRERLADEMDADYHFAARYDGTGSTIETPLYRYDGDAGYYKKDGDSFVERQLEQYAPIPIENADTDAVADKIRRRNVVHTDEFHPAVSDDGLINLANGVLDRETRDLREHGPDLYFTRQIPWEYDPDADADEILGFIEEITPDETAAQTLVEWVGFGLKPEYSPEKFLLLTGEGRNGKGLYFEILKAFYGGATSNEGTVSAVDFAAITGGGRFDFSRLEGSLMNIDGDVAGGGSLTSEDLSKLKKLTGGDYIKIEEKNEPAYDAKNRAKLAFAANEPPRFNERSSAIAERLLHIEFPFKYTTDDDEHRDLVPKAVMKDRLITDEEMSGLLNAALDALDDLDDRHQFAIEVGTTAAERFDHYHYRSDPIAGFADKCLDEQGSAQLWLPKDVIYQTYVNWVKREMGAKKPARKSVFWRKLSEFADYTTGRPKVGDDGQIRVVKGLWFTEEVGDDIPPVAYETVPAMYENHPDLNHKTMWSLPGDDADDEHEHDDDDDENGDRSGVDDGESDAEGSTRKEQLDAVESTLADLYGGDPIPRGSLCSEVAKRHDISPERTESLLSKLEQQRRIADYGGGKYEPL